MAIDPSTRFGPRPALVAALRAGYGRRDLLADIGAGLLVGVVALPLAMAFAIASGCRPEQGLYTGIAAGVIVGLLGGSRVQIAGPTGAFVGICASGVAHFGYGGLALATLVAGALLVLMGLCRLGRTIEFIPMPVVLGFTAGIAVVIASTQAKDALGLGYHEAPGEFVPRMALVVSHAREARPAAILLTIVTVGIIVLARRFAPRAPGALIALVIVTGAAAAAGLDVPTIASRFGQIPSSLPLPSLPDAGLGAHWTVYDLGHRLYDLRWLIIAIAMLGAIESLLSAVVADGMTGWRHDSDTELVAQGVANLASPLVGGLPVTGAIARTATNVRAGARSPVASIVHAATLLLIMLAAAPLASRIPLACLAGVLLVVCWNMAEVRRWPDILRAKRSDAFLLPTAFLLTVLVDLTVAVVVGTLLAMLFFVKRMAEATTLEAVAGDGTSRPATVPTGIEIYEVRGPFFFGAASMIRGIVGRFGTKPKVLVLDLRLVPFVDGTAVFALRDLLRECRRGGTTLLLSGAHERPLTIIRRTRLSEDVGEENIHATIDAAIARGVAVIAGGAPAVSGSSSAR